MKKTESVEQKLKSLELITLAVVVLQKKSNVLFTLTKKVLSVYVHQFNIPQPFPARVFFRLGAIF